MIKKVIFVCGTHAIIVIVQPCHCPNEEQKIASFFGHFVFFLIIDLAFVTCHPGRVRVAQFVPKCRVMLRVVKSSSFL